MSVTSTHPSYDAHLPEWQMMDDALIGERAIKGATKYLPKPAGMVEAERQDESNEYLYEGYKERAQYEHWVRDNLRAMMGLVSRIVPEIELPPALAGMEENATDDGFGLKQLFLRMVRQSISHGRIPVVINIDENKKPYFSTYRAINAINWKVDVVKGRQDLTLAVFREFRDKSDDDFSHESVEVYRVYRLIDGQCFTEVLDAEGAQVEALTPLGSVDGSGETLKGLPYLPVIYCGSTDNSSDIDEVPLLSMARAAIKSYQISADYFQHLHNSSHDQKVIIGLGDDTEMNVTGPNAAWVLPLDCTVDVLKTDPDGIEAKRTAMVDQKMAAVEAGAKVIDIGGNESGEARKARQDDQHATLHTVVITVAEAIEQGLRYAAEWLGAKDQRIRFAVKPEFVVPSIDPAVAKLLHDSVAMDLISADTYWQYITLGKLPERDYLEELEVIAMQGPRMGGYE